MHYYAIINEEYVVMEVVSSDTVIIDNCYIEITEEQYNDEGFLGYFYDQDKDEFVGAIFWMCTSNEIRYDETYRTLTGKLNEIEENISTHTHDDYVSSENLQTLSDIVDTKADINHVHYEYAEIGHVHDNYATQVSLDTLAEEVDGKADIVHSHTEYASGNHTHTEYSEVGHTHSNYATTVYTHNNYASSTHNHNSAYASVSHDHDKDYSAIDHTHSDYATVASVNALSTTVSGKANTSHTHDDRYYTETEIDNKLATKANSTHNHSGVYDVNGAAATAETNAKEYTNEALADEVSARTVAISTAKNEAISTAASDATAKANEALETAKEYTTT